MTGAGTPAQDIYSPRSRLRVGASVFASAKWAPGPLRGPGSPERRRRRLLFSPPNPSTLSDPWVRPAPPLPQPEPPRGAPNPGLRRPRPLPCPTTYGGDESGVEGVLGEAEQDTGLPHPRVPDQQQLEQVIVGLRHITLSPRREVRPAPRHWPLFPSINAQVASHWLPAFGASPQPTPAPAPRPSRGELGKGRPGRGAGSGPRTPLIGRRSRQGGLRLASGEESRGFKRRPGQGAWSLVSRLSFPDSMEAPPCPEEGGERAGISANGSAPPQPGEGSLRTRARETVRCQQRAHAHGVSGSRLLGPRRLSRRREERGKARCLRWCRLETSVSGRAVSRPGNPKRKGE